MNTLLKQKIFDRYFQVASSDLGLNDEVATKIGNAISSNNSTLVGFSNFCLMPKMRSTPINFAVLNRWLSDVPLYLVLSDIFTESRITAEKFKQFSTETLDDLFNITSIFQSINESEGVAY